MAVDRSTNRVDENVCHCTRRTSQGQNQAGQTRSAIDRNLCRSHGQTQLKRGSSAALTSCDRSVVEAVLHHRHDDGDVVLLAAREGRQLNLAVLDLSALELLEPGQVVPEEVELAQRRGVTGAVKVREAEDLRGLLKAPLSVLN